MADQLRTVHVFMNRFEAEIAQTALEAAGIESMISSDDCGGTYPRMEAVELLVRDEDAARAAEVLDSEAVVSETSGTSNG